MSEQSATGMDVGVEPLVGPAMTYEQAEKLALLAIHQRDGRGMVGVNRDHVHERVARAILRAAWSEQKS